MNGENTVSDKSVKELGRIEVTLGRGFYQLTDVMSSSDQVAKPLMMSIRQVANYITKDV